MELTLEECWDFYNALNDWNRIDFYNRLRTGHLLTPEESFKRFMAQCSFLSLMPQEFQDILHQEHIDSLVDYQNKILKFELKRAALRKKENPTSE